MTDFLSGGGLADFFHQHKITPNPQVMRRNLDLEEEPMKDACWIKYNQDNLGTWSLGNVLSGFKKSVCPTCLYEAHNLMKI
jgi:hypothetical protein